MAVGDKGDKGGKGEQGTGRARARTLQAAFNDQAFATKVEAFRKLDRSASFHGLRAQSASPERRVVTTGTIRASSPPERKSLAGGRASVYGRTMSNATNTGWWRTITQVSDMPEPEPARQPEPPSRQRATTSPMMASTTTKSRGDSLRQETAKSAKSLRQETARTVGIIHTNAKGELVARPTKVERDIPPEKMTVDRYARYLREQDKKLGAHYHPMPEELGDHALDSERLDHDHLLVDRHLHRRRPSDAPHPRLNEPRNPMKAAFTDRAGRLREGKHMKSTMGKDGHAPTEWADHGDCHCAVCKPNESKPAGSPSHLTTFNRHTRTAKDAPPMQPFWEKAVADTLNSDLTTTCMTHATGTDPLPEWEERAFQKNLGRKVSSPMRSRSPGSPLGLGVLEDHEFGTSGVHPHRGGSPGVEQVAAGNFNQSFKPDVGLSTNKGRQGWQGSPMAGSRSGVALVLSPRDDDPPPPTKIVHDKKGEGMFRSKFSESAEKSLAYHNQEVFRFADPASPKGRPLNGTPDFANSAGLSLREYDDICTRAHPASPKVRSRRPLNNSSATLTQVLDHDGAQRAADRETADRHRGDAAFIHACEYTRASKLDQTQLAWEVRDAVGTQSSHQVASHLIWPED